MSTYTDALAETVLRSRWKPLQEVPEPQGAHNLRLQWEKVWGLALLELQPDNRSDLQKEALDKIRNSIDKGRESRSDVDPEILELLSRLDQALAADSEPVEGGTDPGTAR